MKQSSDFSSEGITLGRGLCHTSGCSLSSRPTNVNISHSPGIILGPEAARCLSKGVTEKDEGVYHCKASNLKGSAGSRPTSPCKVNSCRHLLPRLVNLPTPNPLSLQYVPFPDFLLPSPSHWASLSGPPRKAEGRTCEPATLEKAAVQGHLGSN